MWILSRAILITTLLCSAITALDTSNKDKVVSNMLQILPSDAVTNTQKSLQIPSKPNKDADLKTEATVTHNSEPAPEFYRGVSASDTMRDRNYDRYGTAGTDFNNKASWLSLDKEQLYKNPYIANAYNKLTNGGSTSTPTVSSLMSPNSPYRDRYDYPSANDYLNNKYSNSGASFGGYTSSLGAPYGPAQTLDYNHYSGSSSGYDSGYGNRPNYGHNSILGDSGYSGVGGGSGYGYHGYTKHGGDYLSSKFGKSSILPLAGAALLGVAATLVANPLLLNFGLGVGKRRRRSIEAVSNLRRKYAGQKLAYRGSANQGN